MLTFLQQVDGKLLYKMTQPIITDYAPGLGRKAFGRSWTVFVEGIVIQRFVFCVFFGWNFDKYDIYDKPRRKWNCNEIVVDCDNNNMLVVPIAPRFTVNIVLVEFLTKNEFFNNSFDLFSRWKCNRTIFDWIAVQYFNETEFLQQYQCVVQCFTMGKKWYRLKSVW